MTCFFNIKYKNMSENETDKILKSFFFSDYSLVKFIFYELVHYQLVSVYEK